MKALSLWQPWASLMVWGKKCVETRSWPIRHRGRLLIHAAKRWNKDLALVCGQEPFASILRGLHDGGRPLPFGAVVGWVDVADCYPTAAVKVFADQEGVSAAPGESLLIDYRERAFGDYRPGRFAFLCKSYGLFEEPIPFRGLQGLFEVPDELVPAAQEDSPVST